MKQTPGLPYFLPHLHKAIRIVPHPDTCAEKTEDGKPIASPVTEEELQEHCTLQLTPAVHETIACLRNLHILSGTGRTASGESHQRNRS